MIKLIHARNQPFHALVSHFVRRLFASEEEQGTGSMGLGLGAVLAIMASPGAFASIFLLDKYSTLLEWLRGQRIDYLRRTPTDEYFFIVLSMTITGLVMLTRWNRLFPDRRDFANLAILPLPVRNIFFANFGALLGLAILFGVVVNGVSALLFPFFVGVSLNKFSAMLHIGIANAVSVFSASLFSFFAVFGLVGVLTLLLPRPLFRPVSLFMRIVLVVGLLSEFFANILVRLFTAPAPGAAGASMQWLPSFWFLGIYESLLGIAKPQMIALGERAWLALAAVIVVSVLAYALCYRRIFVRLPESFDMLTSSRSFFRIRLPEALLRPLFRSPFERACSSFACKVLVRSEPHMMFFGAYLGIGLVLVAQNVLDSAVNLTSWLATPLLIAFFIASGLRLVFDTPAAREANWIFRIATGSPLPCPRQIAQRFILWATLPWQILVLLPLVARSRGLRFALLHVAFVVAFTILFSDLLLVRFRKVPFTCLTQMEIRQLLNKMLLAAFGVLIAVPALAVLEAWLLAAPHRFLLFFPMLSLLGYALARYRHSLPNSNVLLFEDAPAPPFELLKLT